jgi:beta-barrel assembly-enhancing protease
MMRVICGRGSLKWWRAGTLAAAAAVLALVPLNMGGCAGGGGIGSLGSAVGGAVGGPTGNLISAGSTATEAAAMGPEQEDALGQSVAVAVTSTYGLDTNSKLQRYVTLVGLTLANTSAKADGNWAFGVLASDDVNAFAGPNGYIMVTRGALMQMDDESELAGVVAHEIGHVLRSHGLEAAKNSKFAKALGQAAQASEQLAAFGGAVDATTDVVMKKGYGQPQEIDADLVAVELLTRAGYDPNGYVRFLKKMEAGEKSRGAGGVFSTHPGVSVRIKKVQDSINKRGNPGGATLPERFRRYVSKGPA